MKNLIRLARFQFLTASVGLYIIGVFWAILLGASMDWPRMLLGYLIIFLGHLSVSFSNDYFDVLVDRFGSPAAFSGGSGVLVNHPELRQSARRIAVILIVCSMILAIFYQAIYTPPFWFLGYVTFCNLLGWFYAAPPLKLSYRGLGEIANAITSGILVPGLGYTIMRGYLNADALVFTIPLLLYGLGFILAVEIPDIEADRLGQKKTWVARIGRGYGYTAIGILFLAATGFFFLFPIFSSRTFPIDFHLLGLFSLLPLGAGILGAARRPLDQRITIRFVNAVVFSLAMFFILTDGYFISMSMQLRLGV